MPFIDQMNPRKVKIWISKTMLLSFFRKNYYKTHVLRVLKRVNKIKTEPENDQITDICSSDFTKIDFQFDVYSQSHSLRGTILLHYLPPELSGVRSDLVDVEKQNIQTEKIFRARLFRL